MPKFELTFESGEKSLITRIFSAEEGISQLFQISVVALSEKADVDLEAIVGKKAEFKASSAVEHLTERARHWKGVVSHIEQLRTETSEKGQSTYALVLVPQLWLLTQRQGYRIFQHLSIPDIADKLLGEWAIDHEWTIDRGAYPKLEYKVQYGESDYTFLCRLLEEAGIAFLFPEQAGGSLLTFHDNLTTGKLHDASPVDFVDEPNQSSQKEFVTEVKLSHVVRPGAFTIRDHDFRKPSFELRGVAPKAKAPEDRYEQYHYRPGAFLVEGARNDGGSAPKPPGGDTPVADDKGIARHEEPFGTAYATRSLSADRSGKRQVSFASNVFGLTPGTLLTMDRHPHPELAPANWLLLTELQIEGGHGVQWTTSIKAVYAKDGFRPPIATPKPEVKGVQSATVVGPPGEEIYVDEFGRARVQFPWDREGKNDDDSSCWLRVSQGWAGTGFGALALPRVGQEVLVGFLAGDPDQPIIVGRVFNATEQVPYKLPQYKSRSTWKSNSYPGGGGFNEIMFEDAKDAELVYVQAQRNLRRLVKNDETIIVGATRQDLVKGDFTHQTGKNHRARVDGTQDLTVRAAKKELVGGDRDLHAKGDRVTRVGGDEARVVSGQVLVKAGATLRVQSPDLTLKSRGGFVRIDATGVTVVGTVVNINSGGAPGTSTARATVKEPSRGDETSILMSFAMKSGGHLFSQWLRNKLMGSLGLFTPNAVYLDTVASREQHSEHGMTMPAEKDRWAGVTYVAPDTRNVATEGFTTIGAMNSEWNESYTRAMAEAETMIFLLTPDYLASQWCMLEWQQYQEENARRAAAGRPPLHGLVVGFESEEETQRFADGKADTMTVPRIVTTGGHPTALGPGGRGSAISEQSYQQLLAWVSAHRG